jgi:hypothetical protein
VKPDEDLERWLDGDTLPPELRRGLESAAGARPSAEELARMATRLGIGVIPAPPSGSGAAPGGAASPALKLALGSGLAIAVVAGIGLLRKPDAPPAPEPGVTSVPVAATTSAEPPATPNAVAPVAPNKGRTSGEITETIDPPPTAPPATATAESAATVAPVPVGAAPPATPARDAAPAKPGTAVPRATVSEAPARSTASRTPSGHTAPATADLPEAPPAAPVSETQLLRDARLALGSDPGRALALAERHLREYPSGSFGQEREYIAINALLQLGRTSEARARAERFRTSYPRSPYVERLDRVMGR